jgi:hypothetical protein
MALLIFSSAGVVNRGRRIGSKFQIYLSYSLRKVAASSLQSCRQECAQISWRWSMLSFSKINLNISCRPYGTVVARIGSMNLSKAIQPHYIHTRHYISTKQTLNEYLTVLFSSWLNTALEKKNHFRGKRVTRHVIKSVTP